MVIFYSCVSLPEGTSILLGFHLGFTEVKKISPPHGTNWTNNHTFIKGFHLGMHTMWRNADGCGKMTYEHFRLAKKVKKGKGRNAWSPERVHFSDWFFWKFVLRHTNSQMYQGHKKLRLRSEMCLLKTLIIPFRANPQSCPLGCQVDEQRGTPPMKTKQYVNDIHLIVNVSNSPLYLWY
jgi:hypothetical protein